MRFGRFPKLLENPFLVIAPVGKSLLFKREYHSCQLRVQGKGTLEELFGLDMVYFDVIMGMGWLAL